MPTVLLACTTFSSLSLRLEKSGRQVSPVSGLPPDAEESSTIRTIRTQRFLIKVAIALIQKGQWLKKRSVSVLFWRQALRRMRKAVCQGQKEEGNHSVCRAKPEDWGNLFLFIYPWANQEKPLWGVSGDKCGASRKAQALKSKKRQLFTASSMPEKSNKNNRIKYKSPAGLLYCQITITDTFPKNGSVNK